MENSVSSLSNSGMSIRMAFEWILDLDAFDISSLIRDYESLTCETAAEKAADIYATKRQCFWSHVCMTRSDAVLQEVALLLNVFSTGDSQRSRVRTSLVQAKMALEAVKGDLARQRMLDIGSARDMKRTHSAHPSREPFRGVEIAVNIPIGWRPGETVELEVAGIKYEFVPPPDCREGEQVYLNPNLMTLTRSSRSWNI